jgi:hypothetical protein
MNNLELVVIVSEESAIDSHCDSDKDDCALHAAVLNDDNGQGDNIPDFISEHMQN